MEENSNKIDIIDEWQNKRKKTASFRLSEKGAFYISQIRPPLEIALGERLSVIKTIEIVLNDYYTRMKEKK